MEEGAFSARIGDEQRRGLVNTHSQEMNERRIVEGWFQGRARRRQVFFDLTNPNGELASRRRQEQTWNADMQRRRHQSGPVNQQQLEPLEEMDLPVLENTPLWILPDELRHGRALENMVDELQRRYHREMDEYETFRREYPLTERTSDPVVLMMRN
jgi:hypothetical protein